MTQWINQYIPRAKNLRGLILEEVEGEFPDEEVLALQERKRHHHGLVVEIGSGSGMNLLKHAALHSSLLHIGFELRYKRTVRTIEKAERAGLTNVHMVRGDARKISSLFSQGEVAKLFVHFPDPWTKQRWRKHRIIQLDFVEELTNLLQKDGVFSFRTDQRDYFQGALKVFSKVPALTLTSQTTDLKAALGESYQPSSEFEILFASQNHPICSCELVKR